jgi:hypothetical protein
MIIHSLYSNKVELIKLGEGLQIPKHLRERI